MPNQMLNSNCVRVCAGKNLEFSSQAWSPHLKQDIKSLESIQRVTTKYIMGYDERTYDERCKRLQVLPLSYRREVLDLVFLYNCLRGAIDADFTDEITYVNSCRNLRSTSHGLNLQTQLVKTETYKSSYFSRTVTLWNKILLEVRNSYNVNVFKHAVNDYYLNKLNMYCPDNSCSWTPVCRCPSCMAT